MYAKPSNYKSYSQYSREFTPQSKEVNIHEFKTVEEKEAVIRENSNSLVVVDIYATWCGPCKEIAPKLNMLVEKYPQVKFFKENIENDLSPKNTVSAVPTFHFFYKGQFIPDAVTVGCNMTDLEGNINKILNSIASEGNNQELRKQEYNHTNMSNTHIPNRHQVSQQSIRKIQ